MSRSCVSMVVSHRTSRLWTRSEPSNATRRFLTRGLFVILCGQIQRMWTPGLSVHEVLAGFLAPRLLMSLFTSTTWSSSAVHTSWFMKATSLCLMRNWWPCGQRPTTATAVGTLPPSWSSRTSTDESPSCFEPFPTLNVWYLLEQPPPTSSNDKAEVFS